jgi:polygalacturonase
MNDSINIEDFGASPHSEDNSKAIQDAINQAETEGKSVHFPDGTYKISRSIEIGRDTRTN